MMGKLCAYVVKQSPKVSLKCVLKAFWEILAEENWTVKLFNETTNKTLTNLLHIEVENV